MGKMKTHKGAKARFKVTGSGKIMRRHRNRSHGMRKMGPGQKRRLEVDDWGVQGFRATSAPAPQRPPRFLSHALPHCRAELARHWSGRARRRPGHQLTV